MALFPVMARQASEPDRSPLVRSYALAIKLLVGIALPLAAVTTWLAPLMIALLGGAEYLPYGSVALAIMVWSIPFGWINSVTNYLLIALGQQRGLTRAFAVALAFNLAFNLLLIPRYGFAAAAAITIASEIFEGLAFYWYLRKSLGALPWLRWLWKLWVSAGAMTAALGLLWPVHPLLALTAGLGVYALGIILLRAYTPEERAVLADALPQSLRARLAPKRVANP
jgi:O-antigen/teichoic acid export membrane protein